MNIYDPNPDERVVSIFRNGRSRAIRFPKEWEFEGDNVIMSRLPDGTLLLRTGETAGLSEYLKTAEPWTGGDFVESDGNLPPLDEVRF